MYLIGRYERLRAWIPSGSELSPPYILDRKWKRLFPAKGAEWWQSPDGVWIPTVSGGSWGRRTAIPMMFGLQFSPSSTTALNNPYTAGSAGPALAMRYISPGSETLTGIYFNIASYTGTAANVDHINYEVRTGTYATPNTAGGALLTSGTKDPNSATGWIAITGISQALSAGYVWIIIADAVGSGGPPFSDYAILTQRATVTFQAQAAACNVATTADGFATNPTSQSGVATMVLTFSSGTPAGCPFSGISGTPNDTLRRGFYFGSGVLNASLKVLGWFSFNPNANISGIELYNSTELPGGTTLASSTDVYAAAGTISGAILSSAYTFLPSETYRVVFTYGAAATVPMINQIGTGMDATLRAAMPGSGSLYLARASGTPDWGNSDDSMFPNMGLLIEDQVASSAGGVPHLTGYGMAGG